MRSLCTLFGLGEGGECSSCTLSWILKLFVRVNWLRSLEGWRATTEGEAGVSFGAGESWGMSIVKGVVWKQGDRAR